MRLLSHICVTGLFFAFGALAQPRPNFSGTWTLDPMRSRFDKGTEPKSATLQVDHVEPKIKMELSSATHDGQIDYTLETTTDGVEAKQTLAGQPCVVTAQWGTRSGERLMVESTCETPDGPVVTSRVLKLGGKGQMLTTILTVRAKGSQKRANEFYVRKPAS